jgi:MFS family permease
MICPHCQKELSVPHGVTPCPFCGKEIYLNNPLPPGPKMNWLVFYAILLAPAILTLIGGSMHVIPVVFSSAFIGSLVAGIFAGAMLARYRNMRGGLVVLLVFGLSVFSFVLCFVGCAVTLR